MSKKYITLDRSPYRWNFHNVEDDNYRFGRDKDIVGTTGIGSCLAITIYNTEQRVGSLAHISGLYIKNKRVLPKNIITTILTDFQKYGINNPKKMEATLSGESFNNHGKISDIVRKELDEAKIPIIGEDLGPVRHGRIVYLHCKTGKVKVFRPRYH